MKVLIVEDDVVQRDCLEQFLRPRGCWTDGVASVQGAILRLKVSVPDAVIADYVLLDRTVMSFLSLMRGLPKCDRVPVLVISAIPPGPERDGLLAEVKANPPARFMAKPYSMTDLFEVLCEMTGKCDLSEKNKRPPGPVTS
jgi:CheY-like chemotaxis protein